MSQDPTADPYERPADSPAPPPQTPPYAAGQPPAAAPPPPGPGYQPPPTPPPYGNTPYPPTGSSMPAYGGPVYSSTEHPQGVLILVLGILSIVLCALTGPFAWVMGRRALAEIDASGRAYSNRGQIQAGMICGIIGTVLLLLVLAFVLVSVVVAISTSPR